MRLITTLILAGMVALAQQRVVPRAAPVPGLSDLLFHSPLVSCAGNTSAEGRVRVATWNIKAARAAPLDALAAEMRAIRADVIALQEVDVRTRRSGYVDQPRALAAALGFHYVFAASIRWDEGDYGLALVSKWPLARVERFRVGPADLGEPRIVLDVTICVGGRALRLLNHHADDVAATRALGFADVQRIAQTIGSGLLVVGDMNEGPDGPGIRTLRDSGLVDLGADGTVDTAEGGRIDYIFAGGALSRQVSAARVWRTNKSDHHLVSTDVRW
jgi:endonuclease/exonuclease/phosphatase family metal-dependent hydrolase